MIRARWVALLALASCATPYQKAGWWGDGYTDEKVGADTYIVSFKGNNHTDASAVYRHFHRRAREICGKREYQVLDSGSGDQGPTVGAFVGQTFVSAKQNEPEVFGRVRCR